MAVDGPHRTLRAGRKPDGKAEALTPQRRSQNTRYSADTTLSLVRLHKSGQRKQRKIKPVIMIIQIKNLRKPGSRG